MAYIVLIILLIALSYKNFKLFVSRLALLAYCVQNNIEPTDKEQCDAVKFVMEHSKKDLASAIKSWFLI